MSTVLVAGKYRIVVYPNDHRPAHVHIIGGGKEALFYLNCVTGPIKLRENYGFRSGELTVLEDVLRANLVMLCAAWKEIHDEY